jgi:oxalate decarboxylase/phosphoglucose isomerase-like protein (cupin superfamily)
MPQTQRKVAVEPHEVETIMAEWVTAKVMADPSMPGATRMSAVTLFFEPGQGHARHNHPDSEQIIFVISGEGEMMIEHEEGRPATKKISAGSLVYIPRGAYHSTFNTGWEPIRILAVYSPPGPEAAMRNSAEFKVLPAGAVPQRA